MKFLLKESRRLSISWEVHQYRFRDDDPADFSILDNREEKKFPVGEYLPDEASVLSHGRTMSHELSLYITSVKENAQEVDHRNKRKPAEVDH